MQKSIQNQCFSPTWIKKQQKIYKKLFGPCWLQKLNSSDVSMGEGFLWWSPYFENKKIEKYDGKKTFLSRRGHSPHHTLYIITECLYSLYQIRCKAMWTWMWPLTACDQCFSPLSGGALISNSQWHWISDVPSPFPTTTTTTITLTNLNI